MDRIGTACLASVVGALVLAAIGQRLAPPRMAPAGDDVHNRRCDVDAPQVLHAASKRWCADGLFQKVSVTGDKDNVIAVARFNPNGAQTWQLQSGLLAREFGDLTNQMAAAVPGKNIAVDLHDAGDHRVGACARTLTDTTAACGTR